MNRPVSGLHARQSSIPRSESRRTHERKIGTSPFSFSWSRMTFITCARPKVQQMHANLTSLSAHLFDFLPVNWVTSELGEILEFELESTRFGDARLSSIIHVGDPLSFVKIDEAVRNPRWLSYVTNQLCDDERGGMD